MGSLITAKAADGHELAIYRAAPAAKAGGAVVILQEIFGVNAHIRSVADRYAGYGYLTLAPALFDRIRPGIELGYSESDVAEGRRLRQKVTLDDTLKDIAAALDHAEAGLPLATVGFCWGGRLAFAAATRLGERLNASVCYYGGEIAAMAEEQARCPLQFHFGEKDQAIPMSDVETIRKAQPQAELYLYPAGHGFACDARGSYHRESAALAEERARAFLARHLMASAAPGGG